MMKVLSVSTSLSEDSTTLKLAERIITATAQAAETREIAVETEHINIRHLASSLTDMTLTGFRSEELEAAFTAIAEADAIVTVTPVYKSAPVGLHTLFWQLIDDLALAGTPVLIASTGGTARHSLAAEATLRPVLSYLKGVLVPTAVFAATDEWGSIEGGRSLSGRITQGAEELLELALALHPGAGGVVGEDRDARIGGSVAGEASGARGSRGSVGDEFDPELVTPFDQLLGA